MIIIIDKSNPDWITDYNRVSAYIRDADPKMYKVEIKETSEKRLRTLKQNSALHLFFQTIADELNNKGFPHTYKGLSGKEIEKAWDKDLVKDCIWRPVQLMYCKEQSTTQISTTDIDKIAKPLIEFLAKNFEINIGFPSEFGKFIEQNPGYLSS